MRKVFTGQAYGCIEVCLYIDGINYVIQISDGHYFANTNVPDADKRISGMVRERKERRDDVIYKDEYGVSEELLRRALKERVDLLGVVIERIRTYTEQMVRKEIAGTLNTLLNP